MKSPHPKIHLIDTDEPIIGWYRLIMRCGTELRNAKPKFQITEDLNEHFNMPLTVCRECLQLGPAGEAKRHYLYGLVEGQAGQDAEAEEAA
jgi:hypothetical protein